MPSRFLLTQTQAYESARAKLSREARLSLSFVEDGIADDPDDRHYRFERLDGTVIDHRGQGLFVAYRRVTSDTVLLIAVIDLHNPPLWP